MNLKSHAVFWSLATIAFVAFSWVFRDVLFPFVLGATIAYLLEPILEKIVAKGMGRKSAVLLILGTFFLLLTGILAVLLPILVREASAFITAFPGYLDHVLALVQPHIAWAQERLGYQVSSEEIQGLLKENIGKALKVGQGVLGGSCQRRAGGRRLFPDGLVNARCRLFYDERMAFHHGVGIWSYPVHSETTVKTLLSEINRKIAGFVRGQIMVCLILGAMYAVALSIAG
jgi:predicted PurR-regulated permease PerM